MEDHEFQQIGKKIIYPVPDGFFDTIAERTLLEAKRRTRNSRKVRMFRLSMVAAASLVAFGLLLFRETLFPGQANLPETIPTGIVSAERSDSVPSAGLNTAVADTGLPSLAEGEHAVHQKMVSDKSDLVRTVLSDLTTEELQQMAAMYKADPFNSELATEIQN